jgi:phage FluMu protein Com
VIERHNCPVCNRLLLKGYIKNPSIVEIKCTCRSILNITGTGVAVRIHKDPEQQIFVYKIPYKTVYG